MLTGAGDGNGQQGHIPGFTEGVALIHIQLRPLFQDQVLLMQAPVAGIELIGASGSYAVVQHVHQRLYAALVHGEAVVQGDQIQYVILGNRVGGIDQHHMDARRGEIIGLLTDLRGADSHGAVGLKIIPVFALLKPAGVHGAVVVEIIALIFHVQPADGQNTV